jgi:hypothetical protein
MIRTNLDMEKLQRVVLKVAREADKQIGNGPASMKMLDKMLTLVDKDLTQFTHRISGTLADSWIVDISATKARGFFDPSGLTAVIHLDPHAIKPEPYFQAGDLNRPVDYGPIEFSYTGGVGDHNAPARASENFDGHFDSAFDVFAAVLGKNLGFGTASAGPALLPI